MESDEVRFLVSIDDLISMGYISRTTTINMAIAHGLEGYVVQMEGGPRVCILDATLKRLSAHVHGVMSTFIIALLSEHYTGRLYGKVTITVGQDGRCYTDRNSATTLDMYGAVGLANYLS